MSDVIWAPWRMEFIKQQTSTACVLCDYVGLAPAPDTLILVRHSLAYVVLNKYPYAAGHIMVVPGRHVASPAELSATENRALWDLVQRCIAPLTAATECDGINLGMNLGRVAGAGIHEHVHVHLVPRWEGDHNFMPVLGQTRVVPEYLEITWHRLFSAFGDLNEDSQA
jgi:ATP adenylyltransferase